ncbi:hypothetical protein BH11PSE10_BH11PSE10_02170 [soil metagenome]
MPISAPQLTASPAQLTALIHLSIPRSAMQAAMGPAIQELLAAVQAQGLAPTGPWFTHHLRRPSDTFDFEVCVPVAAAVRPVGRVAAGQLPAAARAAQAIYSGPYEGLADAWPQLFAWVAAQGLRPTAELLETYLRGPQSSDDPAEWRTELKLTLL